MDKQNKSAEEIENLNRLTQGYKLSTSQNALAAFELQNLLASITTLQQANAELQERNNYLEIVAKTPEGTKLAVCEQLNKVDDARIEELEKQNAELVNVLSRIYKWELPETGRFWDHEKTQPMSYEAEYGSNGARDYIKKLAFDAIQSNKG